MTLREDIFASISGWRTWLLLAWQDITVRYRRSIIGPFWITLSMAITICAMGFLYSRLFHIELTTYFPLLTAGLITWSFISAVVTECSNAFMEAENYLKQIRIPYTIFILRTVTRNLIVFFHNIWIIIPVILIFHVPVNVNLLLILPGLLLLALTGVWWGILFAMACARYRDVLQIINTFIGLAFLVTPVMWDPSVVKRSYSFVINYNPLYHFIEIIRKPLLGQLPSFGNYLVVIGLMLVGMILALTLFAFNRKRIIFWL